MRRYTLLLAIIILLILGSLQIALGQAAVHVVVVNEFANVRVSPALGASVRGTVTAGTEFWADARSADNEWLRVDYAGEGWVHVATLVVLEGDIAALPVRDPRSIPYGGFESPRAGTSNATGPGTVEAVRGVRVRAGPSTAYPTLANLNYRQTAWITGRNAANTWWQVQYNGVLGWVSAEHVQLQGAFDVNALPVGGIVADAPPLSGSGANDYIAQLKLMLDRLDHAQISLDTIRTMWTDAALYGRAGCGPYPAQPSDLPIASPLLAAHYNILKPLQDDFNEAMANLRYAIDLFIQICNLPGTGNPVGQATVQGALGIVNTADSQFQTLRARLHELIPPDRVAGPNECTLTYNGRTDILPLVQQNVIVFDSFLPDKFITGYCFDAFAGQTLAVQTLQFPDSNIVHFLAVSPLDNPTNFLGVGRGSGVDSDLVQVSPIIITQTGRYVLILTDVGADTRNEAPMGNFAFLISDISTTGIFPPLVWDDTQGTVVLGQTPLGTPTSPDGGDVGGVACPSSAFTCAQLLTCEEARACLQEFPDNANFLDPDFDGIPCEENLCSGEF